MDTINFKEFVIKSAKQYIFENIEEIEEAKKALHKVKAPKAPKTEKVIKVPKIEKTVKVPKAPQTLSVDESSTTNESFSIGQIKMLAEEMKKINKKIDLRNPLINPELFDIISENKTIETVDIKEDDNKNKWKNLYEYKIPTDDNRLTIK